MERELAICFVALRFRSIFMNDIANNRQLLPALVGRHAQAFNVARIFVWRRPMPLKIGDPAPAFALAVLGGDTVSLESLKGRPFVLYFYPKDSTPGCTAEAVDFTKHIKTFEALKTRVIGVSKDSLESHEKFALKQKLKIALASDREIETAHAYGVWVEKTLYGKKSMAMERSTFLIDGKGVIRAIWRKVKVAGHAEAVLQAIREIADAPPPSR
jgi:thioredoxin-dependent peroxiredoxin